MYTFSGKMGTFVTFVEIGGICNVHHWLRGWTPLGRRRRGIEAETGLVLGKACRKRNGK